MSKKVTYTTLAGDRLDQLCYGHYGVDRSAVDWTLKNNPHLRKYDLLLPEGLTVVFLPLPAKPNELINPWS